MTDPKEDFIQYLKDHPNERLCQALRNFLGVPYLLTAQNYNPELGEYEEIKDTFYD